MAMAVTTMEPTQRETAVKIAARDVDFFYGKDHYFEDNSTYNQSDGINLVSSYLQLWPQTAY